MPDTTRTFIAVPVPQEQRQKLARLQDAIRAEVPGARWVEPENFHVTLAFLGDVPHADLAAVCRAVEGATAGFGPLDLRLEGLGCFPNPGRPRTLWAGLAGPGVEGLGRLQKVLAKALREASYPPSDERFSPHVTLARIKADRGPRLDLSALIDRHRRWSGGSFAAAEVVAFASTLTPDGPAYAPLARESLKGGKGETPP